MQSMQSMDDAPIPILQTIDLLGDRLTLTILREAFVDHVRRFNQWIELTGAPPAMLIARLTALVDAGLMERRPVSDGQDRLEYVLTARGLETWQLLVAVWAWLREWSPEGALQPDLTHVPCGHRGPPELMCLHCGTVADGRDVDAEVNVGALAATSRAPRRRYTRTSAPATNGKDLQFTAVMEAIGDRWSALVTGLALTGTCRFSDFQTALQISPTTLTERLSRLSAVQILMRDGGAQGAQYRLTPRGRGLFPIFAVLLAWSATIKPDDDVGPHLRHRPCGALLEPGLQCRGCRRPMTRTSVRFDSPPSGTRGHVV